MEKLIKSNIIALLSILLIFPSFSGCGLFEETITECEEEVNQISPAQARHFQEVCQVCNYEPYEQLEDVPVKMVIMKENCEGKVTGMTELGGLTESNGSWDSRYMATFDFKNKKDRVLVKYTISYGGLEHVYDYVYRWEDVESRGSTPFYLSRTIYLPH